jgi:hypothetical protein
MLKPWEKLVFHDWNDLFQAGTVCIGSTGPGNPMVGHTVPGSAPPKGLFDCNTAG